MSELIPDEILLRIFHCLNVSDLRFSVALVCKRWQKICEEPDLWNRAKICIIGDKAFVAGKPQNKNRQAYTALLQSLGRRCISQLSFTGFDLPAVYDMLNEDSHGLANSVKAISFRDYGNPKAADLKRIASILPNLKEIHLNGIAFSQQEVTQIYGKELQNLSKFTIPTLPAESDLVPLQEVGEPMNIAYGKSVIKCILKFSNLSWLDMSNIYGLNSSDLKELFLTLPQLTHVDFSTCKSQLTLNALCHNGMPENTLKTIKLNHCEDLSTESTGQFLERHCDVVQVLGLQRMDISKYIATVIMKMNQLFHLNLGQCRTLSHSCLCMMFPVIRHVSILNLSGCIQLKKETLLSLAEQLNRHILCDLNLSNNASLDNHTLWKICENGTSLKKLDISSCVHIDDFGIQAVWTFLHHLKDLKVRWCLKITDSGFCGPDHTSSTENRKEIPSQQAVINDCLYSKLSDLKQLEVLDIGHCSEVSNRFCATAKCLRSLQDLNIDGLTLISDDGIKELLLNLRALEHLSIESCKQITDYGLFEGIENVPRLQSLNVSKCPKITDGCIKDLMLQCKHLRSLHVMYCKGIPASALLKLKHSSNVNIQTEKVIGEYP